MADFDLTATPAVVAQEQDLSSRQRELSWRVSFADIAAGAGMATTETADIGVIPAGFVLTNTTAVLRTAEGGAGTIDVGTATDPDGLIDGADMNGTANLAAALAGTEAISAGYYFHTDTTVMLTSGATTLDAAVVDIMLSGYMVDTE
jgi:hypothetical protein